MPRKSSGHPNEAPEALVREVSGRGLQWEADMQVCCERGWWGRWDGDRWELVRQETPGAVEDLVRLAALRKGQPVETDEDWRSALHAKFLKDRRL